MVICVPRIGVECVVQQIPIRVVARSAERVMIVRGVIARNPVNACAAGRNCFGQIVEGVVAVAEVLLPDACSAIDFAESAQLVVTNHWRTCIRVAIFACLRAARVEAIADYKLAQRSIRIPVQGAGH